MTASVLFYVQHLLGVGHLARASLVAAALSQAGMRVKLVQGGPPIAGWPAPPVDTLGLPPVKAGPGGFAELVDKDGRPVTEEFLAGRRDLLLSAFAELRPDILMVEAYPFGRRPMRFELLPLVKLAASAEWAPLVACSVRDILQEGRKPGRDEETAAILKAHFDLVLVHGDPSLVPFDATFPLAHEIGSLIRYTGLVAGPVGGLTGPAFDIVVSAGGGAAGEALMRAARGALTLSSLKGARWYFITGPNFPPAAAAEIFADLPDNAAAVPHRADFRALLANARVSVSQAGYNTAADVLAAGCRAILVPFAAGGETEQTRRAAALAARGLARVLSEADLNPQSLARLIDVAVAAEPPVASGLKLDGGQRTPAILLETLDARPGAQRQSTA